MERNTKILLVFMMILTPIRGFAQQHVVTQQEERQFVVGQEHQVAVEQKEPVSTEQKATTTSGSKRKQATAVFRLMCSDTLGNSISFSPSEWEKISAEKRVHYSKKGVVVEDGKSVFMLALFNLKSVDNHEDAMLMTGGQLPTRDQIEIIKNNQDSLYSALVGFGGLPMSSRYWCADDNKYGEIYPANHIDNMANVRLCTTNIEDGFKNVTITKPESVEYDFVGNSGYGDDYLTPVRYKNKYGFINKVGELVIPLKYDNVYCNGYVVNELYNERDKESAWYSGSLASVCINGKWGYIDFRGQVILPIEYDFLSSRESSDIFRVKKEKRIGLYSLKEKDFIVPISYEELDNPSNKDFIVAKKNGLYGFINKQNEVKIPFKYSYASRFNSGLAAVAIDDKYGYINKSGELIIPLKYDYALQFADGIAGVMMEGKVGYIDSNGEAIVPCMYDGFKGSRYSSEFYTDKTLGTEKDFRYSELAVVEKDRKCGVINKKGELLTDLAYDDVIVVGSSYFSLLRGTDTVFVDRGGHEYRTHQELENNSNLFLARDGDVRAMHDLGEQFRYKKDYKNSIIWYEKAAAQKEPESTYYLGIYYYEGRGIDRDYVKAAEYFKQCISYSTADRYFHNHAYKNLGSIYYNGGFGITASYKEALRYFMEASQLGNTDASHTVGVMYEYGKGVPRDIEKAIAYYEKANGASDSGERIKKLKEELNKATPVQSQQTISNNKTSSSSASYSNNQTKRKKTVDLDDLVNDDVTLGFTLNYGQYYPIGASLAFSLPEIPLMFGVDAGFNADKDTYLVNNHEYNPAFKLSFSPYFYLTYFAIGCGLGYAAMGGMRVISSDASDYGSIHMSTSMSVSAITKRFFMLSPSIKGFIPIGDCYITLSAGYDYAFNFKHTNGFNFGVGAQFTIF